MTTMPKRKGYLIISQCSGFDSDTARSLANDLGDEEITVRLFNCLVNERCGSLSDAAAKYGSWLQVQNFGKASLRELEALLERRRLTPMKVCPHCGRPM
jgi:DNA-directed RNA polymerase alpha subunit